MMSGRKEEALGRSGEAISEFGAVLRAWRHLRGLSVTDLALQAGFGNSGRSYISKLEHGLIRQVSDERLERIAAVLGLSEADLLSKRWPSQIDRPLSQPAIDPWEIAGRLRKGIHPRAASQISERMSHQAIRSHQATQRASTSIPSQQAGVDTSRTQPASAGLARPRGQTAKQQSAVESLSALEAQIHWRVEAAMSHLEVALLSELRQVLQEEFRDIVTQVITQEVLEKTKTIAAIPGEYGEHGEQASQALPGDPGASVGVSNNPGSLGQEMRARAHRNTTTRAALSQGKGMGESVEYKGVLPSKIGS